MGEIDSTGEGPLLRIPSKTCLRTSFAKLSFFLSRTTKKSVIPQRGGIGGWKVQKNCATLGGGTPNGGPSVMEMHRLKVQAWLRIWWKPGDGFRNRPSHGRFDLQFGPLPEDGRRVHRVHDGRQNVKALAQTMQQLLDARHVKLVRRRPTGSLSQRLTPLAFEQRVRQIERSLAVSSKGVRGQRFFHQFQVQVAVRLEVLTGHDGPRPLRGGKHAIEPPLAVAFVFAGDPVHGIRMGKGAPGSFGERELVSAEQGFKQKVAGGKRVLLAHVGDLVKHVRVERSDRRSHARWAQVMLPDGRGDPGKRTSKSSHKAFFNWSVVAWLRVRTVRPL